MGKYTVNLKYTSIVADENIPSEVVNALRGLGADVYAISERRKGLKDPEVWRIAMQKGAVLLTRDKGYLPQLTLEEIMYGPGVVEYATRGLTKENELSAAYIMQHVIGWLFQTGNHRAHEYIRVALEGITQTKRQLHGQEKGRRKRKGLP